MKYESLLKPEGETEFLLGNEAAARAVYEAGVSVATTYPGTPSSEIGDVLFVISEKMGIHFEFAVNEKVAFEMAAATAASGARSFVFMKHVGLNVAMDSFVSLAETGVRGGMVLFSADDPSMHSSQNEQDNRFLGKFADYLVLEPSDPQEIKDFIVRAFDMSEEIGHPVLVRSTTRVSHVRAPVTLGKPGRRGEGKFQKRTSFVPLPEIAYASQLEKGERVKKAKNRTNFSYFNRVEGSSKDLIVTSGPAYNYVGEALDIIGKSARIMKIGMSNPLDSESVLVEIRNAARIIFIEEGGPFIEEQVLTLMAMNGLVREVHGKMNGDVPYSYEMDVDRVSGFLSKIYGLHYENKVDYPTLEDRKPTLCPGCPHRATYYAAKLALRQRGIKTPVIPTDIGCYSLGYYDPYNLGDFLLSMGSSVGSANGFSMNAGEKVIAFIGDSTFFHAGIPALINAYHNRHNFVLVILDNGTTAMTGGQPTPEEDSRFNKVDIEGVIRGIGIRNIFTMDPYDLPEALKTFKKALDSSELSVIISRKECALIADRKKGPEEMRVFTINQDKCKLCYNCVRNFACAAFYIEGKRIEIDPDLCDGCAVCAEPLVCPFNAIEEVV